MTLLDYSTHSNYYLPDQIYPFQPQKQEPYSFPPPNYSNYDEFEFEYEYEYTHSEAELLCFDPLPPTLFDFDLQIPHFNPPPPLTTDFNVDELIIPDYLQFYPCSENYPVSPLYQDYSFPNKKQKVSSFSDVSQCGVVQNCCFHNGGGICGGGGGNVVKEVKEVSAQSKAARERRRKITDKTRELGKLVPGGSKMNTAEMLQAAHKYVTFLKLQLDLLNTVKSIHQENENDVNLNNLPILGSRLIQEKLYTKEKCLIPMDFLPILEKHSEFEDPSISKQIDDLLH